MRRSIDQLIEWILVSLMSFLVMDVLWQVISRYILSAPSSFTDELAGFLLIWVSLLGAAYVTGKNEHLAIDLIMNKLHMRNRKRLGIFINSLILLFSVFVLLIGGSWLVYTRFTLEVKSAALQIPLGYVYIVLPMSGSLVAYYSIDNIRELITVQKN